MKRFILLPTSQTEGILYADGKAVPARFMSVGEARFIATFKTVRGVRA